MATATTTVVIDGAQVNITTETAPLGDVTRTVVVPVIKPGRQDQNGNDVADIPLLTLPDGAAALTAHLPTGYGLRMEGPQAPQTALRALDMLSAQITAHAPAADRAAMTDALSAMWYWEFNSVFLLSTVSPTTATGTAADAVMGLTSRSDTALSAVLIDTNGQGDRVHLALDYFNLSLITGAGTFDHVRGHANIIADGASQTFILDGGQDRISAGGGDDRIIIGESIAESIGHVTFNWLDGGEGYDTLQLGRAGREGYALGVSLELDGLASLGLRPGNFGNISFSADHFEAFHFAEARADTSERGSVTRLYESLLERSPDAGSLDYWVRTLAGDTTLADVAQAILGSSELAGKVPQSNAAYVTWLYDQVLGRAADAGGLAWWTATLASDGISRADLALALVDSDEKLKMDASHEIAFGATDVGVLIRMYDAMYDRRPDLEGLNYWIDRSEAGTSLADIADSFADAAESTDRLDDPTFIAQLYRTALEREATTTELADWNGLLAQGHVDRGDVLLALTESAEMVALVGVMSTTFELA